MPGAKGLPRKYLAPPVQQALRGSCEQAPIGQHCHLSHTACFGIHSPGRIKACSMPQWVLENAQEGSEYFEIHLALQLPAPSFLTEDVGF